jgi:hypothetical protein
MAAAKRITICRRMSNALSNPEDRELSPLEQEAQAVAADWFEHDGHFWDTTVKMTAMLHVAKAKTIIQHRLYAENRTRGQFMQAVLRLYYPRKNEEQLKTALRRTYESIAVVKHYAKQGDSVKEIVDRIIEDKENWSSALKALTPAKETAESAEEHQHIFVCTKCGETKP